MTRNERELTIDRVIEDIILLREDKGISLDDGIMSTDELIIKILDLIEK